MPKTTVIILHYRGVGETIACLRSVMPQCDASLDLLLVDNGSADDLAAALAAQGIIVPVLRLPDNRGWAGGNNAGIERARDQGANIVCLLNNDTVVPDGVFARLAATMRAIGPCLLHPAIDFADPAEGAQLDPARGNETHVAGHPDLYRMGFAYGACLMVPISVFDRIGRFDERFFLQLEETDFYERATRAGLPTYCDASVRIVHAESLSFGGRITLDKTYYMTRNSLLLAMKNVRRPKFVLAILKGAYWRATTVAGIGEKPALARMFRWILSNAPQARVTREGFFDFCVCRFGRRRNK